MPLRAWGVTRQNLVTLNNAWPIMQTILTEMGKDGPYAGNVAYGQESLAFWTALAQLVADHLTAEGK